MKQLKTNDYIKKAIKVHGEKYDYSKVEYIGSRLKVEIICKEHGSFFQLAKNHLMGKGCLLCSGNKKLTTFDFINNSVKVHEEKYDYSKVEYTNRGLKVEIICPEHGVFSQTPNNHLGGQGCPKCSGNQKSTTSEFIEKAKKVHGDKYDYSLVDYINSTSKVKIICPEHGVFSQTPSSHVSKHECPECSGTKQPTTLEFKERAKFVHGDKYDYSRANYTNAKIKLEIVCPEHGSFFQTANSHLSGKGCMACSGKQKLTTLEFIEKAKKVHENKYDYSLVEYKNSISKVDIVCKEHGVFTQRSCNHLEGVGCPKCNSSHGEQEIRSLLLNKGESFVEQYRIKECKDKYTLPFDFAVFENEKLSYLIEFDGRQHYVPVTYFGGIEGFNRIKERDSIKTKYCIDNNIRLVRIKYDEEIKL